MVNNNSNLIKTGAIAGFLGSALYGLLLWLLPPFRAFSIHFLKSGWLYFSSTHSVYGWLLLCLILLGLIGLITVLRFFWPTKEQLAPEYYNYVSDTFHGVTWRWQWVNGSISNLWCFCPTCDAQLVISTPNEFRSLLHGSTHTNYYCERCGRNMCKIDGGDNTYVLSAISREIHRRIRTHEYKIELTTAETGGIQ